MTKTHQHPSTEPTSSNSTAGGIERRIERLFLRLGAIYGHVWFSIYKNENLLDLSKQEWSQGLQRFDNQVLKEAILYFREQNGYPPSLPQFIECCQSIKKRGEPCFVRQEPVEVTDKEIGKQHLKNIFAMLKK